MEKIKRPQNTGGSWGLNDEVVRLMIKRIIPASVVDFGCGLGKYGLMCRELFDERVVIDGVDKFGKTCIWLSSETTYNRIFNEDILTFDGDPADLAIFGDVIEHLDEVEWIYLFKKLITEKKYKYVIVVVPLGDVEQGVMGDNEAEVHKSIIEEGFADYLVELGYNLREKHLMIADGPDGPYRKMAIMLKI